MAESGVVGFEATPEAVTYLSQQNDNDLPPKLHLPSLWVNSSIGSTLCPRWPGRPKLLQQLNASLVVRANGSGYQDDEGCQSKVAGVWSGCCRAGTPPMESRSRAQQKSQELNGDTPQLFG
jgi:hypothetical protein